MKIDKDVLKVLNESDNKQVQIDIDGLRKYFLDYSLGQLTIPVYNGSAAADRADSRAEQGEDVEWIHPGTLTLELDETKGLLIASIDNGFGNPEELGSRTIVSHNFEDLQKLAVELLDDVIYRLYDELYKKHSKYYSKLMLAGQKKDVKGSAELIRIDLNDSIVY